MNEKVKISITLDRDIVEWIDEVAEGVGMSRSEFINFVLSGGREASDFIDKLFDKWFNQKKTELKSRLGFQPAIAKKEAR
ncbi:MAG: ribbon-helix-helix domain-containing protein [Candidatus Bathyarchaeia archaeon]